MHWLLFGRRPTCESMTTTASCINADHTSDLALPRMMRTNDGSDAHNSGTRVHTLVREAGTEIAQQLLIVTRTTHSYEARSTASQDSATTTLHFTYCTQTKISPESQPERFPLASISATVLSTAYSPNMNSYSSARDIDSLLVFLCCICAGLFRSFCCKRFRVVLELRANRRFQRAIGRRRLQH
jgi:hypothetical protein